MYCFCLARHKLNTVSLISNASKSELRSCESHHRWEKIYAEVGIYNKLSKFQSLVSHCLCNVSLSAFA